MRREPDGWDITVWIGAEEGRNKAEEIFNAVMELIETKFDVHTDPDGQCSLDWTLSMSGMNFDEENDEPRTDS